MPAFLLAIPGVGTLLSWLAAPLVKWGLIIASGFIFTLVMRADAASGWKEKAEQLELAVANRDQIIADHTKSAEEDRIASEVLDKAIEGLAHDALLKNTACVLSADELASLQRLAGAN